MSNQLTKRWLRLAVCVAACFLIMSTLAQFGFPQQDVHVSNTVIVNTPPKFSLWEGVDVAIENLVNTGTALSVENVLKELEEMKRRNEVRLPYSYSHSAKYSFSSNSKKSRGSVKVFLTPSEKKKKDEFAAKVAKRLAVVVSAHPEIATLISLEPQEPQPGQFKTKKEFVDAYVTYKMKNADEDIKAKYAKRMNGMNAYRFEMRREAEGMWKLAQKK